MRLLHARTFELFEYLDTEVPKYTILSHRWEEGEVLFADIQRREYLHKRGFKKIRLACAQTVQDGYDFIWIDTCGIDKSSSAELSEAINSMFAWYKNAAICYVYLSDLEPEAGTAYLGHKIAGPGIARFETSKWFTRGWTLQELLAPARVLFYDSFWTYIGSRGDLKDLISDITMIDIDVLDTGDQIADSAELEAARLQRLFKCSNAKRMSWAAARKTSRVEDRAYSLLGLFDVNMPLLYGEGAKAFIRLQEEIIKTSKDLSIFAWGVRELNITDDALDPLNGSPLAPMPEAFTGCNTVVVSTSARRSRSSMQTTFSMSKQGIQIENARLIMVDTFNDYQSSSIQTAGVSLECPHDNHLGHILALKIWRTLTHSNPDEDRLQNDTNQEWHIYYGAFMVRSSRLSILDILSLETCSPQPRLTITEAGHERSPFLYPPYSHIWVRVPLHTHHDWNWEVRHAEPKDFWNPSTLSFDLNRLRGAEEHLNSKLQVVLENANEPAVHIEMLYTYMGRFPHMKNDKLSFTIRDGSTDGYSSKPQQITLNNDITVTVQLEHVEREDICVAVLEVTREKSAKGTFRSQMNRMRHGRLLVGSDE